MHIKIVELEERVSSSEVIELLGLVSAVHSLLGRCGTRITTFWLEDGTGALPCTMFDSGHRSDALVDGSIVRIRGIADHSDRGVQVVVREAEIICK